MAKVNVKFTGDGKKIKNEQVVVIIGDGETIRFDIQNGSRVRFELPWINIVPADNNSAPVDSVFENIVMSQDGQSLFVTDKHQGAATAGNYLYVLNLVDQKGRPVPGAVRALSEEDGTIVNSPP